MSAVSTSVFDVLLLLIPGLVTTLVYYGMSEQEKPTQFNLVVLALIFTVIVHSVISLIVGLFPLSRMFADNLKFGAEQSLFIFMALIVGLALAALANSDWVHSKLRKLGLTQKSWYPSVWSRVFREYRTYVVLHLKDERRLYGWPQIWPQSSDDGHFLITRASWITETKLRGARIETVSGEGETQGVLINVNDVKWVELVKDESDNG